MENMEICGAPMLDRIRDAVWTFVFPRYVPSFGEMSRSKSMRILGMRSGSSIAERYRSLMRINHPDMGGSAYLASKINEAKGYLLESNSRL